MKRIAMAVLAVSLLGGTAAVADPDHNNGGHNEGGHNNGAHTNGGQPHGNPQVHSFQGGPQNNNAPQGFGRRFQGGPPNNSDPQVFQHQFQGGPPNNNGPQVFQHQFQGGPPNNNGPQVFERRFQGGPQGQNFRPGGQRPRYSQQSFPRVFNPGERFHWRGGFWRGPPGWYYHNWFYGEYLPYGWFAPDWWIADFWDYDLPVPPYGYEWVRNGPDALLVNINTGFVAEVVPGIFY